MTAKYNVPNGTPSSIGTQLRTDFFQKKALIEARREQYFSQLADVTSMPKNMGKKITRYHYLPLLNDENLNDQGIDAAGALLTSTNYTVTYTRAVLSIANASKAAAASAINDNVGTTLVATAGADGSAGTGFATLTLVGGLSAVYLNVTKANAVTAFTALGAVAKQHSGNLYGSTKDIGSIDGKMPVLSETGGRVNKVGFKRKTLEGSLEKFGFFDEYTQESMDFDSDDMLMEHINREMVNGANEMTEDALQIDLITQAGVVKYAGAATSNATVTGGLLGVSTVTYSDLMRLAINLDQNRCPKNTTVITGTRMVDTRVIPAARIMYVGSELLPTLKAMKDLHNAPAFISVEKYAAGTQTVTGEVGAIDNFRIVVVPEMMKWAGAGAAIVDSTCYDNGAHYDVFPMLVVGDESFTTIGFQTDGKSVKFNITHKAPGEENADRTDPYGEMGFMSIKWYYGFMLLRPERLACIRTAAKL